MNKYTVCLYDGSVVGINRIVATQVVDAESFTNDQFSFDPIAVFYDVVGRESSSTTYQNRITKSNFIVHYTRILEISDTIQTIDFGSYSRFVSVFEGDYDESVLKNMLDNAVNKKRSV